MSVYSNEEEFEEVESPFAQKQYRQKSFKSTPNFNEEPPLIIENRPIENPIEYLPPTSVVRSPRASKKKNKLTLAKKVALSVIGLLFLRLVFMERGVIAYHQLNNRIEEKRNDLKLLKAENKEINQEIQLIQYDRTYQKQLAKEQLGVIAADEFLILFGSERLETSKSTGHSL